MAPIQVFQTLVIIAQTNYTSMTTIGEAGKGFKFLVGFMNSTYLHAEMKNSPTLVK